MAYLKIKERKGRCTFTAHNDLKALIEGGKLLTPICKNCGKPHELELAQFDSVEIKEAVRIIDHNRDTLLGIIEKLAEKANPGREKTIELKNTSSKIWREMDDAVKEICGQMELYKKYGD